MPHTKHSDEKPPMFDEKRLEEMRLQLSEAIKNHPLPKPWTPEEIQILREGYGHTKTRELARILGRKIHQVWNKAGELNLTHDKK